MKRFLLFFLLFLLGVTNLFAEKIVVETGEIGKLDGYEYKILRKSSFGYYIIEIKDSDLKQLKNFLKFRLPKKIIKKSVFPSDPYITKQWAINNMKLNQLWDINTDCSNIPIAVVDTGVAYNHVDLEENILKNSGEICGNGIDDDNNGFVDDCYGWNFAYNNNNPDDDDSESHGSHVTGIIAAKGNNGTGVTGVCWNASVIPVKALDSTGNGTFEDVADGIDYAIKRGAKIINLSVEAPYDSIFEKAIKEAYENNVIIVCAAGNAHTNLNVSKSYPASFREKYPNVINVASYNSFNEFSSFSNYGSLTIDVAAPGSDIYSTVAGNKYSTISGSSMATGFVTGFVAHIMEWENIFKNNFIRAKLIHAAKGELFNEKTVSGGYVSAPKIFDNVTEPILFTTKISPYKNEKIVLQGFNLKDATFHDSKGNVLKKVFTENDNATVFAPLEETYINAQNSSGTSNKILINPGKKFLLYLNNDWNLISIPVYNSAGVSVEFFNESEVETLWGWNGSEWSIWSPKQDILNIVNKYGVPVLQKLYCGKGYWLNANTGFSEFFEGENYNVDKITTENGWNLAGAGNIYNISSIYNSVQNVESVWKWDGSKWKVASPVAEISDLIKLYKIESFSFIYPGEGFWIKVK
jgi:hypothetical protein